MHSQLECVQRTYVLTYTNAHVTGYFNQDQDNSVNDSPVTLKTSLTVNTSELDHSGEWVLVKWVNVPDPNISDWVGLYSVPGNFKENGINVTAKAPVKFQVGSLEYNEALFLRMHIAVCRLQSDPHDQRRRLHSVQTGQHQTASGLWPLQRRSANCRFSFNSLSQQFMLSVSLWLHTRFHCPQLHICHCS